MAIPPVLLTCLLLSYFCAFGECCDPAEIGTEFTIKSDFTPAASARVRWLRSSSLLFDSSKSPPNVDSTVFDGTRTQLTIKNVTTEDANVFVHVVDDGSKYSCPLQVYKRARSPSCDPVTLTPDKEIRTNCTTSEVFPQAKCQFTLSGTLTGNAADSKIIPSDSPSIDYTHNEPPPSHGYDSTRCTLLYSLSGLNPPLQPGQWTVQVNMYPNVSVVYGTSVAAPNSLSLSLPTPTVNTSNANCPQGLAGQGDTNVRKNYIRQGAHASCTCTRAHPGNPPGSVEWKSTQSGTFEIMESTDTAVTIKIFSKDTFTCESKSVLSGSHTAEYTPQYAYGPADPPTLSLQPSGTIYLCEGQSPLVTISCGVATNSYNPSVLFTITRDRESQVLVNKQTGDVTTAQTSISYIYPFTTYGNHSFKCGVENEIFNDMNSEKLTDGILVYEPPSSPPNLQVTGSSIQTANEKTWAKQGSDINIACTPGGGAYPSISSISVTCGGQTADNNQFTVSGENLTCKCALVHSTRGACKAFNLDKEITVNAAYGPDEVKMTFTNHHPQDQPLELNLCTPEGVDLDVNCVVNTTVRPELEIGDFSLIKPDSFTTLQQPYLNNAGGQYMAVNRLKISTAGSYSLTCEAKNSKFTDFRQTQSKTVQVRQPPATAPVVTALSSEEGHGTNLVQGDDVIVTCRVSGGTPLVQSVNLACGDLTETGTSESSVDGDAVVVSLIIPNIPAHYNLTDCVCQATHVTGCYDMTGSVTLTVLETYQPPLKDTGQKQFTGADIAYAVVGTALGILGLEAVMAAIIYFVRRGKRQQVKRGNGTEYDTVTETPTHYINVPLRDPNYLTLDLPGKELDTIAETPTRYQNVTLDVPGQESSELEMTPRAYENVTLKVPHYQNWKVADQVSESALTDENATNSGPAEDSSGYAYID